MLPLLVSLLPATPETGANRPGDTADPASPGAFDALLAGWLPAAPPVPGSVVPGTGDGGALPPAGKGLPPASLQGAPATAEPAGMRPVATIPPASAAASPEAPAPWPTLPPAAVTGAPAPATDSPAPPAGTSPVPAPLPSAPAATPAAPVSPPPTLDGRAAGSARPSPGPLPFSAPRAASAVPESGIPAAAPAGQPALSSETTTVPVPAVAAAASGPAGPAPAPVTAHPVAPAEPPRVEAAAPPAGPAEVASEPDRGTAPTLAATTDANVEAPNATVAAAARPGTAGMPPPAPTAVAPAAQPGAAPAPPATLPAIDLPPGADGFPDALGGRVLVQAGQRIQHAEIQLHPAELGPVRVHVSVDDGTTSVAFHASHPHTRDAIEQSLPRLRELFGEQGLTLGSLSVSDQPTAREHGGRGDGEVPRSFAAAWAVAAVDDGAAPAARRLPAGLVDLFA